MKQPRRSRRDSSSEDSDRDRRDYPARPKKARSDSAPFPPPPPPPAPAPAPVPAAGSDDGFRRLLDEVRTLDKACDRAKAEAERHKADAARALDERDAIVAKVGSLESELYHTKRKLEEKTTALDEKSLAVSFSLPALVSALD